MKGGSLRFRLMVAAAGSIVIALALASMGLIVLFERHVERRFVAELESDLRQLASGLTLTASGTIAPQASFSEPRFAEPLSGLYWQISENGRPTARSRSLWDTELVAPTDDLRGGEVHQHMISGPAGSSLFAVEREVVLPTPQGERSVRAIVAIDHAEITAARNAFGGDLIPYVALLAALLTAAAWVQVTIGLRPLNDVRVRLADVRAGQRRMLGPGFPDEVRPLANEVDLLLQAQEVAIAKARSRAADLAHGLRTPLTLLQNDAEELKTRGEPQLAEEIAGLAQSMRRHVDRELARSRAGLRSNTSPGEPVRPILEGIVGVVRRLPQSADLTISMDVPADMCVRVDALDLAEIMGNLIENASRWAVSTIRICGYPDDSGGTITIEDDGPGISEGDCAEALARGGRLDERRSGTGLGLAIVQDILENYNGTLQLGRSGLGGLMAEVRFA
jgi:signal transduction histidine kinase